MEVTITMLIAAIVIGITYTAYTIVSQSFIHFKGKNEGLALLANVDHLLQRDFARAELIVADDSGITMQGDHQAPVHYEMAAAYLVRKSLTTDTFKVAISGVKMFFENQNKDFRPGFAGIEENRIDELSLILTYQDEMIPFHYTKTYSSANLIQRNPHALN
ncbi:hypothetical protein ACFGVR_15465 [Mucilaginibacter sp. AW1-3]